MNRELFNQALWSNNMSYEEAKAIAQKNGISLSINDYNIIKEFKAKKMGENAVALLIKLSESIGPGSTEERHQRAMADINLFVSLMPAHVFNAHFKENEDVQSN